MRSMHTIQHSRQTRSGVTLTEVLMSLMIMSIGVSLVASLFPVAALRSAQATKLTNAAILKYNAETIVDLRKALIFDPDGDYATATTDADRRFNLGEHFRIANLRNYIIDPNGFYGHAEAGLSSSGPAVSPPAGFCNWFGNTGNTSPYTGSGSGRGLPRFDGGLQSQLGQNASGASDEQLRAMRLIASTGFQPWRRLGHGHR